MTTHGSRPSPRGTRTMSVNGLSCTLHMPKAQKSRFDERGKELVQGLAPSAAVDVFRVDDFPGCPRDWARSEPEKGLVSYFFRAEVGHMVWLDLNGNLQHPHHVAALISAQGINALSGQHVTMPVELQQFQFTCPKHGTKFTGERFCNDCGFDWPPQNYLATTTTPYGRFWRDGFRGADGKTREFVFTEKTERGVAFNLIGEERTDAFGVALFVSKEQKPAPAYRGGMRGGGFESTLGSDALESLGAAPKGAMRSLRSRSVEVGAGALVQQDIQADDKRLDYWQQEPTALIRIYYCGEDDFADITGTYGGRSSGGGEGFLGGTPVGNE